LSDGSGGLLLSDGSIGFFLSDGFRIALFNIVKPLLLLGSVMLSQWLAACSGHNKDYILLLE
jgi:hypothetical protein